MAGINKAGGKSTVSGGQRFTGSMEMNNHLQGRGGKTMKKSGPAAGGSTSGNRTSNGGINRGTKGKG